MLHIIISTFWLSTSIWSYYKIRSLSKENNRLEYRFNELLINLRKIEDRHYDQRIELDSLKKQIKEILDVK